MGFEADMLSPSMELHRLPVVNLGRQTDRLRRWLTEPSFLEAVRCEGW